MRDVERVGAECVVTVTPTYSGCPATRVIEDDIRSAVAAVTGDRPRVVTALAPAWTTDWIAPEARRKLREAGIAPPHATAGNARATSAQPVAFHRARARGALPELRIVADVGARAVRLDGVQGAIPLRRLPRAVRLLQAALTRPPRTHVSKFHSLPVASVERETRDAIAITFDVPEALRDAVPLRARAST